MMSPLTIKTIRVVATVVGVSLTTFGGPGVNMFGAPIIICTTIFTGGRNCL